MRKLKTILVTCIVASSLFAAAGTAWARSASVERGTSWTADQEWTGGQPGGASWETFDF
ncbi:MAG: hypothetical protein AABM32_07500 [Chloroflexota bacterium]